MRTVAPRILRVVQSSQDELGPSHSDEPRSQPCSATIPIHNPTIVQPLGQLHIVCRQPPQSRTICSASNRSVPVVRMVHSKQKLKLQIAATAQAGASLHRSTQPSIATAMIVAHPRCDIHAFTPAGHTHTPDRAFQHKENFISARSHTYYPSGLSQCVACTKKGVDWIPEARVPTTRGQQKGNKTRPSDSDSVVQCARTSSKNTPTITKYTCRDLFCRP